jgi:hypothetical protein
MRRVKLLDKFEQSMERLMEGTAGALFNQDLDPAVIGKKLEQSMLAQQRASMGTSIVPNVFVVGLHPRDYAQVAGYRASLSRQMETFLAQVATGRKLSVVDRIQVTITEDAKAGRRRPNVDATIADRRSGAPDHDPDPGATSSFRSGSGVSSLTASLRALEGPNRGRVYIVPPGSTNVGRSPENDIILDSPEVSRRHARIECGNRGVRIHDLNSANGTRVNGEAIRVADVETGDEITFGGQRMAISIHRDPGGR